MVIPESRSLSGRILGLRPQNQLDRPQNHPQKEKTATAKTERIKP
jgi:hypothetical protein